MRRRRFLRVGGTGLAGLGGAVALPRPTRLGAAPVDLATTRRRSAPEDPVRLSSNENPLGVCDAARRAILEHLDVANQYPGVLRESLLERLAGHLGVPANTLVLGNGSTEILQMAVQAYAGSGVPLVVADPTFEDLSRYAEPYPFSVTAVPLASSWAHDLDAMRDAVDGVRGHAVVYVCNPNNPTGTLTPSAQLEQWIQGAPETTIFVVDEAYFEYVRDPAYRSALPLAVERPNVVVVRTFSKIYGMAGLRLGFAIARSDTADLLRVHIGRNNANQLALAAAVASLGDDGVVPESLAANDEARAITERALDDLGLERLPSHTNFLMHRIPGDQDTYRARMLEAGWRVGRSFPPMLEWNRLSFGLPSDMAAFAITLHDFRSRGWV